MEPLVELRQVAREYPFGSAVVHALRGVTLRIGRGETVVVMGPSGSGKSTLLHLMGCLDRPSSGEVLVGGRPVHALADRDLARVRRERIGIVFQSFSLIPVLTALENVEYPLMLRGTPAGARRRLAGALLDEMGLAEHRDRYPHHLSGGQQQRVAIARALVGEPALVLADEPTAHLDSSTSEEILSLLKEAHERRGSALVLATHDSNVLHLAERLVRLQDGRVISDAMVAAPAVARMGGHHAL